MTDGILVTGGAGFIGHHLVRHLAKESDRSITVIDNLSNANPNFNPKELNGVKLYTADIRNREVVEGILKRERIGTCIHLAAKISVSESIVDPNGTIDVNVNGTLSVLSACAESGVKRFILASSAAVYGDVGGNQASEAQELNPLSPYGSSKAAAESLMSIFRNAGKIQHTIALRFFNVYGIGQSPEYAGVITKFKERLSQGLPPVIFGKGDYTRDFVAVEDVVHAIKLASDRELSGTFNIGTGIPTTIKDLARVMTFCYGRDDEPIYKDAINGDIRFSCADISRARRLLGFVPQCELYSTLKMMFMPSAEAAKILTG